MNSDRIATRPVAIVTVLLFSTTGWAAFGKTVEAHYASKASFKRCVADERILCEPGSQLLAESIYASLSKAAIQIEAAQFSRFQQPIRVYTYATRQSFARHSGGAANAGAATSNGAVHISPKLLAAPERVQGVVTHELSHLNLLLRLGSWSMAALPSWFSEGLATFVSNGGGAETVSSEQAFVALREGKHFVPNEMQFPLLPKYGDSFGLTPHMFYRQSALFVAFLHDDDPAAFESCLRAIEQGSSFKQAMATSYRPSLSALWNKFQAGQRQGN
jgi:hypothetical protein